jgi:hypothetical protein
MTLEELANNEERPLPDSVLSIEHVENDKTLNVLCIPARDELRSQAAVTVPQVICMSALPPFAVEHARTLYKRLRHQFFSPHIIICFWHFEGALEKVAARLKIEALDRLLTTLPQIMSNICEVAAR